jgi:hypothetical protein
VHGIATRTRPPARAQSQDGDNEGLQVHSRFPRSVHDAERSHVHHGIMIRPSQLSRAQRLRSAGYERVRGTFRWIVGVSIAGAAAIFGIVQHQIPGRATTPATSIAGTGSTTTSGATTGSATGNGGLTGSSVGSGSSGFQTAPTPTEQAPVAISGGTGH